MSRHLALDIAGQPLPSLILPAQSGFRRMLSQFESPSLSRVCTQKLSGNGAWGRIGFPDTKLPEAPDEL
jgi:hypothetical protein